MPTAPSSVTRPYAFFTPCGLESFSIGDSGQFWLAPEAVCTQHRMELDELCLTALSIEDLAQLRPWFGDTHRANSSPIVRASMLDRYDTAKVYHLSLNVTPLPDPRSRSHADRILYIDPAKFPALTDLQLNGLTFKLPPRHDPARVASLSNLTYLIIRNHRCDTWDELSGLLDQLGSLKLLRLEDSLPNFRDCENKLPEGYQLTLLKAGTVQVLDKAFRICDFLLFVDIRSLTSLQVAVRGRKDIDELPPHSAPSLFSRDDLHPSAMNVVFIEDRSKIWKDTSQEDQREQAMRADASSLVSQGTHEALDKGLTISVRVILHGPVLSLTLLSVCPRWNIKTLSVLDIDIDLRLFTKELMGQIFNVVLKEMPALKQLAICHSNTTQWNMLHEVLANVKTLLEYILAHAKWRVQRNKRHMTLRSYTLSP